MRRALDLPIGSHITFSIYHGILNQEAEMIYEKMLNLKDYGELLEISNADCGLKIRLDEVKLKQKEHDFEYNLQIYDVVISGEIC